MPDGIHCPLCSGKKVLLFTRDKHRSYLRCSECLLVFVPPEWHLSREEERAEYNLHQNDCDDPGYRKFLARLADPLMSRLAPGARGLDFGCGPGPALAAVLRESDFEVALYDSFFTPDESVLDARYNFICATEVVEHLHHPGRELQRLWNMLEPNGCLGVMTKLVIDREAFNTWHYKNDPTHVCFFSEATWRWWAKRQGAGLEFIGADVILLQRES